MKEKRREEKGSSSSQREFRSLDAFIALTDGKVNLLGCPEHMSSQLMFLLGNFCDTAVKRGSRGNRHVPVYWWNREIERHEGLWKVPLRRIASTGY